METGGCPAVLGGDRPHLEPLVQKPVPQGPQQPGPGPLLRRLSKPFLGGNGRACAAWGTRVPAVGRGTVTAPFAGPAVTERLQAPVAIGAAGHAGKQGAAAVGVACRLSSRPRPQAGSGRPTSVLVPGSSWGR